jgi:outer membrane translocation and assembly module TamA
VPWTVGTFAVAYEDFAIRRGTGTKPPVQLAYSSMTAPGLGANPTYLHSTASGAIDWRPSEGYARRGGLYEIGYHNYTDLDDAYSFDRLDGEVVQHIPILKENWVVSLRGRVQTTLDDKDVVPYFLLPSLGSGSTLRGYGSWRFRDRHSELFSVEWRWIPSRFALDMAIFYDAGKVTSRRSDLGFSGLKGNIGIGARFHGPAATPLRIELARGQEGLNLVFSGGPAF